MQRGALPCFTHSGPHLGEGLGGGETFTLEVMSDESPPPLCVPRGYGWGLTATDFILSSSGKEGLVLGSPARVLLAQFRVTFPQASSAEALTPGQVMLAQKTLMTPRSLQFIIF